MKILGILRAEMYYIWIILYHNLLKKCVEGDFIRRILTYRGNSVRTRDLPCLEAAEFENDNRLLLNIL